MSIKSIWIGCVGLILSTASAWAGGFALQGVVKDSEGHPIKGADIRIETKNSGKLIKTVKTDANGRYTSDGLPAGNYRITLIVNGAVKTSINNTKIQWDEPTQLNFDLTATSASRHCPLQRKEHTGCGCRRLLEVVCLVVGSPLMTMEVGRRRMLARKTSYGSAAKNCNGQFTA